MKMFKDLIVEEVRSNADKIAAKFDYDPVKYVAHLKKIQKKFGGRLVSYSKRVVGAKGCVFSSQLPSKKMGVHANAGIP
jgi:hypothetical protein